MIALRSFGQVIFNNPSFEGPSANNSAPPQWFICGGTPDVLPPNMGGPFVAPSNGNTCVGMVNSLPGIEERLGQTLPDTLSANSCYSFDIDLRYVPTYFTGLLSCNPGRFRVWLGDSLCRRNELVYISPAITHGVWRSYTISFVPSNDYTHILFDVTHVGSTPVNVCMAIDNIRNEFIGFTQGTDLGNDTTLCPSDQIVLDASKANSTYLWQDNSTDSILTVGSPGLYWVEVTDAIGCISRDSILIDYADGLFLGNDTVLCPNTSLVLNPAGTFTNFLWSDSSTGNSLLVDTAGLYWVSAIDTIGCLLRDTIIVAYEPKLNIGNDTIVCSNDSLILVSNIPNSPTTTFLWQDNSTNPSIVANDSAWYSLTTTSAFCVQVDSLFLDKTIDPMIDLGNDTSLCLGQSILLDATATGATSYLWSNSSSSPQITVSTTNLYKVTVTIGNCTYQDSIDLIFNRLDPFDLGADTTICATDNLILRGPSLAGYSYSWSNSSDADSLVVNSPGKYWLDVEIGNCKETDTIIVSVSNFDESLSNLGTDSTLCNGQSILLDATALGATSYLWNDNSTNPLLLVSQAGDYLVTISDGVCSFVDSIRVSGQVLSSFDLGPDTLLCPSDTLRLFPPFNSLFTYRWQDNSTDESFLVNSAGKYWVDVFEGKCIETDTINITYNNYDPSELNLGNDTSICPFDSILIDATVNWGTSYLWNDNSTSAQRYIKNDQLYIVTVTAGNCEEVDSITLSYLDFQLFDLGIDTTLCLNDSLILRSPGLTNYNYLWQDGSSASTFVVKQAGKYWLTASFGPCTYTDTIVVSYNSTFAPRPNLGQDTNLCEGVQLVLDASDIHSSSYRWHDGSTQSTFIASGLKDSTYSVESFNGICVGRDTIVVGGIQKPRIISTEEEICEDEELVLNVSPPNGTHIWQDGSQGADYTVLDSGKYTVETTNQHCVFNDSIMIKLKDCDCTLSLPNVITPNGDGINDLLRFEEINCEYQTFEIKIFNRFGKVVFQTNKVSFQWDGRSNENKISDGQYFYLVDYTTENSETKVVKGTFTLLR